MLLLREVLIKPRQGSEQQGGCLPRFRRGLFIFSHFVAFNAHEMRYLYDSFLQIQKCIKISFKRNENFYLKFSFIQQA